MSYIKKSRYNKKKISNDMTFNKLNKKNKIDNISNNKIIKKSYFSKTIDYIYNLSLFTKLFIAVIFISTTIVTIYLKLKKTPLEHQINAITPQSNENINIFENDINEYIDKFRLDMKFIKKKSENAYELLYRGTMKIELSYSLNDAMSNISIRYIYNTPLLDNNQIIIKIEQLKYHELETNRKLYSFEYDELYQNKNIKFEKLKNIISDKVVLFLNDTRMFKTILLEQNIDLNNINEYLTQKMLFKVYLITIIDSIFSHDLDPTKSILTYFLIHTTSLCDEFDIIKEIIDIND